MKKQGFAFLMVLCLLFSLCIFSNAEEATQDEEYEEESLIPCEITGDAFEPGKVIVVLKKNATTVNQTHTPESFGDVGVVSVEDLSYITNEAARKWVDEDNYHQILALTLVDGETRAGVVNAIRKLEQRSDVLSVSPNYTKTWEAVLAPPGVLDDGTLLSIPRMSNMEISTNTYPYSTIKLPQAWEITTGNPQVKDQFAHSESSTYFLCVDSVGIFYLRFLRCPI